MEITSENNISVKEKTDEVYALLENYAAEKKLPSTAAALVRMKEIIDAQNKKEGNQKRYNQEFLHCLEVCLLLLDLYIPISATENDNLLSAVILHIYPELFNPENLEKKIMEEFGFNREIFDIVNIIREERHYTDEEQKIYYERIQENKLALLAALADRGNIMQKLYLYSTWNAHRYIDETKVCYYPMCIYGKEHYHQLLAPISVLKEKIKSLIEMDEIFLQRYEVRESELIQDILALREENATIKGIIAKFKGQATVEA